MRIGFFRSLGRTSSGTSSNVFQRTVISFPVPTSSPWTTLRAASSFFSVSQMCTTVPCSTSATRSSCSASNFMSSVSRTFSRTIRAAATTEVTTATPRKSLPASFIGSLLPQALVGAQDPPRAVAGGHRSGLRPAGAIEPRVDLRELGPEEEDLRRVVDPQENQHEGAGGAVDRGGPCMGEVEPDQTPAGGEQDRREDRPQPHVPPVHAHVGEYLVDEGEEGSHDEEGEAGVERSDNPSEDGQVGVDVAVQRGQ